MVVICCHIYLWLITYPCMKIEKPQNSLDRGQINCPVWPEIAQDLEQLTTPFRSFRSLFLLVQSTSITIYPQSCWLHPLFCAAVHLFLPQICCIWHLHPCWSLYWWNHHFCGSKSPFSWSIVFPKSSYACFFPKNYCQLNFWLHLHNIHHQHLHLISIIFHLHCLYFITCS